MASNIKVAVKGIRAVDHGPGIDVSPDQPDDVREHLAEEMADVHFLIEQLVRAFDLRPEFDRIHEKKLERLLKLLGNGDEKDNGTKTEDTIRE
jgi:hypothetical protein